MIEILVPSVLIVVGIIGNIMFYKFEKRRTDKIKQLIEEARFVGYMTRMREENEMLSARLGQETETRVH